MQAVAANQGHVPVPQQVSILEPEPIPIPDPNPKPPRQPVMQMIAEFLHDYFFLLLALLVLLEVFVLPRTGLSEGHRSVLVFMLCSGLIVLAQGIGSLLVYWLVMGIILVVFYGDVLIELGAMSRRGQL
jgi:hypothetical protein